MPTATRSIVGPEQAPTERHIRGGPSPKTDAPTPRPARSLSGGRPAVVWGAEVGAGVVRLARIASLLGVLLMASRQSFGVASLFLGVVLLATTALRWVRRRPSTRASGAFDAVTVGGVVMLNVFALLLIRQNAPMLDAPVGVNFTASAAYLTVVLAAAVPVLFAVHASRAVWGWLRISTGDDERPRPWTASLAAAIAGAGSVTVLAVSAPPAFRPALGAAAVLELTVVATGQTVLTAVRAATRRLRTTTQTPCAQRAAGTKRRRRQETISVRCNGRAVEARWTRRVFDDSPRPELPDPATAGAPPSTSGRSRASSACADRAAPKSGGRIR